MINLIGFLILLMVVHKRRVIHLNCTTPRDSSDSVSLDFKEKTEVEEPWLLNTA